MSGLRQNNRKGQGPKCKYLHFWNFWDLLSKGKRVWVRFRVALALLSGAQRLTSGARLSVDRGSTTRSAVVFGAW